MFKTLVMSLVMASIATTAVAKPTWNRTVDPGTLDETYRLQVGEATCEIGSAGYSLKIQVDMADNAHVGYFMPNGIPEETKPAVQGNPMRAFRLYCEARMDSLPYQIRRQYTWVAYRRILGA